jgi:protein-disulfide isomerase
MHRELTRLTLIFLLTTLTSAQQPAPTHPAEAKAKESNAKEPAATQGSANLPSKETVEAFLQQMFGFDSSLSWTVGGIRPSPAQGLSEVIILVVTPQGPQRTTFYVTADGKHMIAGDLIPFGVKPFAEAREKLEKGVTGPARGPADAPVTMVEFSDLQCPRCKEAQPTIEKLLSEEKNIHFVFQNFPLPAHPWAAKAAAYADCVGRASNDAFWKFVHDVYEQQEQITETNADEKLTAVADGAGVKGADIATCAANPDTAGRVERSADLAKSLDVMGTPTVFVNGRRLASFSAMPYDTLKAMVEFYGKQPR